MNHLSLSDSRLPEEVQQENEIRFKFEVYEKM